MYFETDNYYIDNGSDLSDLFYNYGCDKFSDDAYDYLYDYINNHYDGEVTKDIIEDISNNWTECENDEDFSWLFDRFGHDDHYAIAYYTVEDYDEDFNKWYDRLSKKDKSYISSYIINRYLTEQWGDYYLQYGDEKIIRYLKDIDLYDKYIQELYDAVNDSYSACVKLPNGHYLINF